MAYFLEQGVPVDQQSTICCPLGWNWTPLQMAASHGHVGCVRLLLAKKANVNFQDPSQYQAIHRASARGHVECLQVLLKHGADPNAANEDGVTPLIMAVSGGHTTCVNLLLKAKASARKPHMLYGFRFYFPLQIAINNNDLATAKCLLQHDSSLVNARFQDFSTALHIACEQGNAEAIELLLSYGADTSLQDYTGKTAIELAIANQHEAIVERLMQKNMQQLHPFQRCPT